MRIWGVPGEGAPRRQCRPPATHSGGWPGQDLGSGPGSHGQHCAVARVRGRVGTPGQGGGKGCEHWKWTCRSARRGQSHFGTPKPIFFSHLSPTSLAAGRGVPREQTGPTGEQEVPVHCRTGDVLHTRSHQAISEATKAPGTCRGCVRGSVLPKPG